MARPTETLLARRVVFHQIIFVGGDVLDAPSLTNYHMQKSSIPNSKKGAHCGERLLFYLLFFAFLNNIPNGTEREAAMGQMIQVMSQRFVKQLTNR